MTATNGSRQQAGQVGRMVRAILIGLVAALPGPAAAQEATSGSAAAVEQASSVRAAQSVRACDPKVRELLEQGRRLSPTVARMLDELDRSDLFVYVETGRMLVPGMLRFAAARPAGRFVRITLNNRPEAEALTIASLGHELQHAIEVAGAPEVRDTASLAKFYRTHGQDLGGGFYCTREAQRVTKVVSYEVATKPPRGM